MTNEKYDSDDKIEIETRFGSIDYEYYYEKLKVYQNDNYGTEYDNIITIVVLMEKINKLESTIDKLESTVKRLDKKLEKLEIPLEEESD